MAVVYKKTCQSLMNNSVHLTIDYA